MSGSNKSGGRSGSASSWSPFRQTAFTVLWTATVVSNIGTWMYNAASGWLMTSLNPDPQVVALVQVATSLPMFLFALPAGALADMVDKRLFLIWVQVAAMVVGGTFAMLVSFDIVTPTLLLVFTFLVGTCAAFATPAWSAVIPDLVPKEDISSAIALNGVGINVSRAVGPALGGVLAGVLGIAAPLWINAISNVGVIGALAWWRSPKKGGRRLPGERFLAAVRAGFRHSRNNPHLRATLFRAIGFFIFASAYWALLPSVARSRVAGGPGLYGILLGTIGAGAVGGAFLLPRLRAKLGADRMTMAGTLTTAAALVLFAVAREPATALAASLLAGASWITVVPSISISAQMALPEWVRARGLAMFWVVFYGAMAAGSAIWGKVATVAGLPAALFIAAAGIVAAIPLTWRWKLQTAAGLDLSPSSHWPEAPALDESAHDQGPVLVTLEYRIDPLQRDDFLDAIQEIEHLRRRDGAYAWGVFEDAAEKGRFLETFLVESWLEHLRQHERVTNADRVLEETVRRFHCEGEPLVTHFIAAEPAERGS